MLKLENMKIGRILTSNNMRNFEKKRIISKKVAREK